MTNLPAGRNAPESSAPALGGWHGLITHPAAGQHDPPRADSENGATPPDSLADLLGISTPPFASEAAQRLASARLGIGTSLLAALRCKHAETAAHSVRVAIACSVWASEKRLPVDDREAIEIAALLHDIGKIALPDSILLKAGKLTDEEQATVDRHRLMGVEILSSCCGSLQVLDIISNAPAWYNGRRMRLHAEGELLPLGARMLAIADAYDSMTSGQVYRPARSHERAIQELFEWAGTQFDPQLVQEFESLSRASRSTWPARVESRWLCELDPTTVNLHWQLNRGFAAQDASLPQQLFQERLLDNMYDAVIFVDASRRILLWNRGAERLTGIEAAGAYQRAFDAELIDLRDERGELCVGDDCPVNTAQRTGMQSVRRLLVRGQGDRDVIVDTQSIPVVGDDGAQRGVAIVLHDASGQVSLEERCLSLHQKATRDPLTQLSNRAEFDRVLTLFVDVHLERRMPCSLIIMDIDRFKQVNDNYGHQAGDEAIKSFAQLLKAHSKAGDLAARYGGEEFVLLCANCSNAAATERAEELRRRFSELPQAEMGSICITASFGVTELQPGDTPETMLRRADRALLLAKDTGRNKVVQLGGGSEEPQSERRKTNWWPWHSSAASLEVNNKWQTTVPVRVAVEKLRGFIADHNAQVVAIEGNAMTLEVSDFRFDQRRKDDRPIPMTVELSLSEEWLSLHGSGGDSVSQRTRIDVAIRPKRTRDRRKDVLLDRAQRLSTSLRAYLMATPYEPAEDERSMLRRATTSLLPWFANR